MRRPLSLVLCAALLLQGAPSFAAVRAVELPSAAPLPALPGTLSPGTLAPDISAIGRNLAAPAALPASAVLPTAAPAAPPAALAPGISATGGNVATPAAASAGHFRRAAEISPSPLRAAPGAAPGAAPREPDRAALDARFDGSAAAPARRSFWPVVAGVAALLPVSTSFHELGHYLAARAAGRKADMRIQKVLIADHDSLSYPKRIAVSAAGPVFNLILAAATAYGAAAQALPPALTPLLWTYAAANALFGVTNLLPLKARGLGGESGVSDGRHIVDDVKAWRAVHKANEGPTWDRLAALDKRPAPEPAAVPALTASPEDEARIDGWVARTLALQSRFDGMSAAELRRSAASLKRRRRSGESLDGLLPEAFALAGVSMARTLGKRPYAEQLAAAAALHLGRAVEQRTGEGKTLSVGLAAFLGSLDGPVDVFTFNPYLAVRDAGEIGKPLALLGVSVAALEGRDEAYLFSGDRARERHASERALSRVSRAEAYRRADVVYGHTNAFVFDHLFDQDAASRLTQARRGRAERFAVVDEVDAAMMEEADSDFRIVSVRPEPDIDYNFVYAMTGQWRAGEDFALDESRETVTLTPKAEAFLAALRASDPRFARWKDLPVYARNALKARHLLRLDRDYAVVMRQVVILDPHTGRLMHGRNWEDGLHRFVEVKEGLSPQDDYRLSSHMSLEAFFRQYKKVSGISGTLEGTEKEFAGAYGLAIVRVPPHRPSARVDRPARLYRTADAKITALIDEALAARKSGRPVLIGAANLAESALIARRLEERKEPFERLNGLQGDEQAIVERAGRPGALTVATQVAGRGTDIRPAPAALKAGGLLVLLTSASESPRVDLQYRGRAGRQGEPGETRLLVSLEDDLLRLRATTEERAAQAASFAQDGAPASPDAQALLRAVQDRAERAAAAARDERRKNDRAFAPFRERYFRLRAAMRAVPFPGRARVLAALHRGWGDFIEAFEDAPGAPPSFDALIVRPAWRSLLPWSLLGGALSGSAAAARRYFEGTFYASAGGFVGRRLLLPVSLLSRSLLARLFARVRWKTPAIRLLRGVTADAPGDWRARHRLAALLFAQGDYSGAAAQFQAQLESQWSGGGRFTDQQRRVVANAIDNLALSLEMRSRGESGPARAQDLRLAYELSPTTARKSASETASASLSDLERSAAGVTPPFMRIVYLDKARSDVDAANYKRAEYYFTRVIEMSPQTATAFVGRGYARKQLKDEAGASSDLLESLRLRVLSSRQFGNMRLAYSRAEGSSLDAARLDAAFSALAADGAGRLPRGASSDHDRRQAAAYAQAARANLDAFPAHALSQADQAVRLDGRYSAGYDLRATALYSLGRYRESYESYVDSLLWEFVDRDGKMGNLYGGHATFVQWKPSEPGLAEFARRLKSL